MIVSGTKKKKFIFIRLLWKKMVKSCVFHSVPKYKKTVINEIWLITILLLQHHTTLFISEF